MVIVPPLRYVVLGVRAGYGGKEIFLILFPGVLCNYIMRKLLSLSFFALGVLGNSLPSMAVTRCGDASFYGSHGDGFAWRRTANGETFNPGNLTTAHPSLPMGTRVQVVNQRNGRSVTVRVNDRGPFVGGRVLDLSSGAFGQIASHGSGVVPVCYTRLS